MAEKRDMDEIYKEARRRADKKIKFYRHLRSYITVNVIMMALNLFSGNGLSWLPVAFFWGIGLFTHYVSVFGFPGTDGMMSKDWEKQQVEKEIRQLEQGKSEDTLELPRIKEKVRQKNWDEGDLV